MIENFYKRRSTKLQRRANKMSEKATKITRKRHAQEVAKTRPKQYPGFVSPTGHSPTVAEAIRMLRKMPDQNATLWVHHNDSSTGAVYIGYGRGLFGPVVMVSSEVQKPPKTKP